MTRIPGQGDVVTVFSDIAERRKAEQLLIEKQLHLANLMDLARIATWEFDAESGLFTFDDQFYSLYATSAGREGGYRMPAEVYFREFVHPDDLSSVGEVIRQVWNVTDPDYSCRLEHRIVRRDGVIRNIVVRFAVIMDSAGRVAKTYGANQDITELRQAEKTLREAEADALFTSAGALKELTAARKELQAGYNQLAEHEQALAVSEEKFMMVAEITHDWDYRTDPAGGVVYCSPSCERLTGYTTEDFLINPNLLSDIIHPEDREVYTAHLARIGSAPEACTLDFRIITKSGDERWIGQVCQDINAGGHPLGRRSSNRDITLRKETEQALIIANRKLLLLGSITRHDILNKVTVIIGYLNMMRRKTRDPALGEQIERTLNAAGMIRVYTEFTRYYQDLGINGPVWHDVRTLVAGLEIHDIPVRAGLEGLEILADSMFEKVIGNLYDNTVRHSGHAEVVTVSYRHDGSGLTLFWKDDGVGVPEEDKERIFERGFGKNTGFGLFLTREILAITGITIRENGEPGKGVSFEISVPQGVYRFSGKRGGTS